MKEPKMYPHHGNGGNGGWDNRSSCKADSEKHEKMTKIKGVTATGKQSLGYIRRERGKMS